MPDMSINRELRRPKRPEKHLGGGWATPVCNAIAIACLVGSLAYFLAYYRPGAKGEPTVVESYAATVDIIHGLSPPESSDQAGGKDTSEGEPLGEAFRLPVTRHGETPQAAVKSACQAAEKYVAAQEAWERQRIASLLSAAQQSGERARQEQAYAVEQLQAFSARLPEIEQDSTASDSLSPTRLPKPVDESEQEKLNRRLAELLQRRDSLVLTRTPLHPAVKEIESEIEDLRERIQTLARQSPWPAIKPQPADSTAATAQPPNLKRQSQAELVAVVKQAEQALQEIESLQGRLKAQKAGAPLVIDIDNVRIKPVFKSTTVEGLPPWAIGLMVGLGAGLIAALWFAATGGNNSPGFNKSEPRASAGDGHWPLAVIPADDTADWAESSSTVADTAF